MKTLLINPPAQTNEIWVREGRCQQFDIWGAPFAPLSLAYIAGQIKSISEVLIIDSGPERLNTDETLIRIQKYQPDLIIISTSTPTLKSDLGFFVPKIKNISKKIIIAAIGIHVTALPKKTLENFPDLDFIICGEPELTALDLAKSLNTKQNNLSNISGIAFRLNNSVIINPPRCYINNLDSLQMPCWNGVNFQNYLMPIKNRPFTLISFARGCPYSCKFCNSHTYYGKTVRKREPKKIIEEIQYYIDHYNVKDFLFWTEFITLDKNYLKEVLNLIKEKNLHKQISWVSNSRVDVEDLSIFKEMKDAGCWQIAFGIEFGSEKILQMANKGPKATLYQAERALKATTEAGLTTDGHFILGYPKETEETMQQTIDFANRLPLTFAHFYFCTPFPGSELYEEAVQNNWFDNFNWTNMHQNKANLNTKNLSSDTVNKYVAKAYKTFYLRFKIIFRILQIAKTPKEFFNIIKIGGKFVKKIITNKQ